MDQATRPDHEWFVTKDIDGSKVRTTAREHARKHESSLVHYHSASEPCDEYAHDAFNWPISPTFQGRVSTNTLMAK